MIKTRITLDLPVAFLLILSDDIVYNFVVCNNYSVHITTSHYKQSLFVVLAASKTSCILFCYAPTDNIFLAINRTRMYRQNGKS